METQNLTKEIQKISFWSLPVDEVLNILKTDIGRGLEEKDVQSRLKIFGQNIIEDNNITPAIKIFFN